MSPHPLTPDTLPARLQRELTTMQAMVEIYCRSLHRRPKGDLCPECREILSYAKRRLAHCPFQTGKPTCGKCPIHCYKQDMRERVRQIMRFSGPKMIRHHPILALIHLLDGLRKTPSPFARQSGKGNATEKEGKS